MTYFPEEIFQIILDYAGINGISAQQLKMFNKISVITLLQLYNRTFQQSLVLKSRMPAFERRKIILKLIYSRFNRSDTFTNIYTLYFQEYQPEYYDTSDIVLNTSYRICFSTNTFPVMGVISKINKASVHIKPFAYIYEINENVWMHSFRVFDFNNFLKTKIIKLRNVESMVVINYFNRRDYSHEHVSKSFIPEHEHHLINYIV
jgi:hypothetical protein